MSFTVTLSSPPTCSSPSHHHRHLRRNNRRKAPSFFPPAKFTLRFHYPTLSPPPLRASPSSSSSSFSRRIDSLVDDPRNWSRRINSEILNDDEDEDDDENEEEEDRSLDLLVKFVENVFKKVSRKSRKAVRSVLPPSISTKLVAFSVNGVLVLAFLWVLKAFIEVVCTLGSVVFVSILLIRVTWSAVSYLQESRYLKIIEPDDDHRAWTGSQPAT